MHLLALYLCLDPLDCQSRSISLNRLSLFLPFHWQISLLILEILMMMMMMIVCHVLHYSADHVFLALPLLLLLLQPRLVSIDLHRCSPQKQHCLHLHRVVYHVHQIMMEHHRESDDLHPFQLASLSFLKSDSRRAIQTGTTYNTLIKQM